jgi:CRP-like cAMP-binding protein
LLVLQGVGEVKNLVRGDWFGELALLHNEPRAATVRTTGASATQLLKLERRDFERFEFREFKVFQEWDRYSVKWLEPNKQLLEGSKLEAAADLSKLSPPVTPVSPASNGR